MSNQYYFVKILKKNYLSTINLFKKKINNLNLQKIVNSLKKKIFFYKLNKKKLYDLSSKNLLNTLKSNKFFLTLFLLIILFLSNLSLPSIFNGKEVQKIFKEQLHNKLDLKFDLSQSPKYRFFPRPHFVYINSTIKKNDNEISKIKKLKIFVSLRNFFSVENLKVRDLVIENANFNLGPKNYKFFVDLLEQEFKNGGLKIINSNFFFRNNDQVLFINKFKKLIYYYDNQKQRNFIESKNELFNQPYTIKLYNHKDKKKFFSEIDIKNFRFKIKNELDYDSNIYKGLSKIDINQKKIQMEFKLDEHKFSYNLFDKLNENNFSYRGDVNLSPFYSSLYGMAKEIEPLVFFSTNSIILQSLKTEILNNKNFIFNLGINFDKFSNLQSFKKFFLKFKIEDGLLDIDDTNFAWKNSMNFKITNSLIYVSNGELILDGKLILTNKNPEEIYQFLLTPKNYRTDFKKINLDYTYNFDQKVMKLRNIKIDDKFNEILNLNLKSLIFKNNKLQNKVYLKGLLNKAIKSYAG